MKPREILEMIEEGESGNLEFKRKVRSPRKIAKELSAFANTRGGIMMVGVDDDGTVVGIHSEKSVIDIVEKACQFFLDPPLKPVFEIAGLFDRDIVLVHVKESDQKPHKIINGDESETDNNETRVYIRMGEKSVIASKEMTRLMRYVTEDKPVRLSIGDKEKRLFAYLDKYEKATVKDFARLTNISRRRAERLMIRLVRAGALQIHNDSSHDYFTLV